MESSPGTESAAFPLPGLPSIGPFLEGSWARFKASWKNLLAWQLLQFAALILFFGGTAGLVFLVGVEKVSGLASNTGLLAAAAAGILGVLAWWSVIATRIMLAGTRASMMPGEGLAENWKATQGLAWSFMWLWFLIGILVMGALMMLVIPALVMLVWLAPLSFIFLFEGKRASEAVWASRALVKGRWWPVFARGLLAWLIFTALSLIPIAGQIAVLLLGTPMGTCFQAELYAGLRASRPGGNGDGKASGAWIVIVVLGWLLIAAILAVTGRQTFDALKNLPAKFTSLAASARPLPQGVLSAFSVPGMVGESAYLAVGKDGKVFVMGGPHAGIFLREYTPEGALLRSFGKDMNQSLGFSGPIWKAVDDAIYHSDIGFHTVQRLGGEGGKRAILPPSQNGEPLTTHGPMGMAQDEAGNLYVCEMFNHRIQVLDTQGQSFLMISRSAQANWSPISLGVRLGKAYVLDNEPGILVMDAATGAELARWQPLDATGQPRLFAQVAVFDNGRVMAASGQSLHEFSPEGQQTREWNFPPKPGQQWAKSIGGIAAGPDGTTWVADIIGGRILKVAAP